MKTMKEETFTLVLNRDEMEIIANALFSKTCSLRKSIEAEEAKDKPSQNWINGFYSELKATKALRNEIGGAVGHMYMGIDA